MTQPGNRGVLSGEESAARIEEEVVDTTSSPSKPRCPSKPIGLGGNILVGKIHCQRQEEEEARKARDAVFDAGLIGLWGVVADKVKHIILKLISEKDECLNEVCVSQDTSQESI